MYLKFHMQKGEIIKFLMVLVCALEKVRTACKLCFMLMHVFVRISVKWRNLAFDILAYFGTEFRRESFPNTSFYRNYGRNHFDIVKALKYVCEEREISLKPMAAILGIIFSVEGPVFANTISANRAFALRL